MTLILLCVLTMAVGTSEVAFSVKPIEVGMIRKGRAIFDENRTRVSIGKSKF